MTTRSYDDRLRTIARVREAGIAVCCGGILGLGEDRAVGGDHQLRAGVEHGPAEVAVVQNHVRYGRVALIGHLIFHPNEPFAEGTGEGST
mgnify:CR=1 FL=1